MERRPATAQDVALVVAAADLVARYANQNPMTQMQLGTMIADMHALLVDRVDNGPRAHIAVENVGDASPAPNRDLATQADQPKAKQFLTTAFSSKQDTTGDHPTTNKFNANFVVAEPLVKPFLPIEESVRTNAIVCLECGKHFMTLKRHLLAVHNETDIEYRKKFGLSADYPMICEEFENSRRKLMQDHGAFKPLTKEERRARLPK